MRLLFNMKPSAHKAQRIGVQDGDDNRHVGATNGHGQSNTHNCGQASGRSQHADSSHVLCGVQEVSHGSNIGSQKATVQSVSSRQHQRGRVEQSLQFSVGHQRSGKGHTSNVGSQKDGGFDHGCSWVCSKGGEMVNVGGDTGQNGGGANQGMESSYQLRKVSDFNLLGNG